MADAAGTQHKYLRNTAGTSQKHSKNARRTPKKTPHEHPKRKKNTTEIQEKHCRNTTGMPQKHHRKKHRHNKKYHRNTTGTPHQHYTDTAETPAEHGRKRSRNTLTGMSTDVLQKAQRESQHADHTIIPLSPALPVQVLITHSPRFEEGSGRREWGEGVRGIDPRARVPVYWSRLAA